MIVKTLYKHENSFALGEVEIKLMPGIPQLHVVGQPDSQIRECGLKLKSALRSCDLEWPRGNQIVVNLRPSYFRKTSSGVDLAIALGFMALTGQLSEKILSVLKNSVVYGEVALDGRVFAPPDLEAASLLSDHPLITGVSEAREGRWLQLKKLNEFELDLMERKFSWAEIWQEPTFPDLEISLAAADELVLASHMNLNVLVGGPQGTGKSTWAKALYSLTSPPLREDVLLRSRFLGESSLQLKWRPCETPHHSTTALAMIGGGVPLQAGIISRAHGGVLIMDEFLRFQPQVLEALREPLEAGYIELARKNERQRFPAKFQLIATSNLCPCGKLKPGGGDRCRYNLIRCRSVCTRLSGPLLDRFDMLLLSHEWLGGGPKVSMSRIQQRVLRLREFASKRGPDTSTIPDWVKSLALSHRRHNSLLRVARGLADLDQSPKIKAMHLHRALEKVVDPMQTLNQLFG